MKNSSQPEAGNRMVVPQDQPSKATLNTSQSLPRNHHHPRFTAPLLFGVEFCRAQPQISLPIPPKKPVIPHFPLNSTCKIFHQRGFLSPSRRTSKNQELAAETSNRHQQPRTSFSIPHNPYYYISKSPRAAQI